MNPICLALEIGIDGANNDAGVCRFGLMKFDEVLAVQSQERASLGNRVREHFFVGNLAID